MIYFIIPKIGIVGIENITKRIENGMKRVSRQNKILYRDIYQMT